MATARSTVTSSPSTTAVGRLVRHRCQVFSCDVGVAAIGRPARPFDEIEHWLRQLERRFSRFVADNELYRLNHSDGAWITVSPMMKRLLAHALEVAVLGRGLVNVAVTPSVLAAGYTRSWPQPWELRKTNCATAAPVAALTEVLEVRGERARLLPDHRVDFGALAKGLWADDVVDMVGDDCAVSLGGDVRARGTGPDGDGWPIGLPNGRTAVLVNAGVATSGTSKRRSGESGNHHVIDPRTGLPAQSGLREVTVIAPCAATAEWMSTALLVGGPSATELIEAHGAVQCYMAANECREVTR